MGQEIVHCAVCGIRLRSNDFEKGEALRVDDAYASPLFNPEVDRVTGFQTRSVLCVPITDRGGAVFAVAQLLNKRGGAVFDALDELRFREFARGLAPILEVWARMAVETRRAEPPRMSEH